MIRRIVVKGLDGFSRILATEDKLGGCPALLAFGQWQQAKLVRVEERYAFYQEVDLTVDDGA